MSKLIFTKKSVIKLYGFDIKSLQEEYNNNLRAQRDPIWSSFVLPVKKLISCLYMRRGKRAEFDDFQCINKKLMKKFIKIIKSSKKHPACELLGKEIFKKLTIHGIRKNEIDYVKKKLSKIRIPDNSMHGDLKLQNIVFVDSSIKIIDWFYYREKGSLVLDFAHFYSKYERSLSGEDLLLYLKRKKIPEGLIRLAEKLNLSAEDINFAYCIFRAAVIRKPSKKAKKIVHFLIEN